MNFEHRVSFSSYSEPLHFLPDSNGMDFSQVLAGFVVPLTGRAPVLLKLCRHLSRHSIRIQGSTRGIIQSRQISATDYILSLTQMYQLEYIFHRLRPFYHGGIYGNAKPKTKVGKETFFTWEEKLKDDAMLHFMDALLTTPKSLNKLMLEDSQGSG